MSEHATTNATTVTNPTNKAPILLKEPSEEEKVALSTLTEMIYKWWREEKGLSEEEEIFIPNLTNVTIFRFWRALKKPTIEDGYKYIIEVYQ